MKQQFVDMYMATRSKYFLTEVLDQVKSTVEAMPDEDITKLNSIEFKEPSSIHLISIFCGMFGVDRLLLGDLGLGFIKLFTFGGFGVLWILDWFKISTRTKDKNLETFKSAVKNSHV